MEHVWWRMKEVKKSGKEEEETTYSAAAERIPLSSSTRGEQVEETAEHHRLTELAEEVLRP
jgi:hypothetical protein